MFVGVDLGTSGLKAILLDGQGHVVTSVTVALEVSRPQPLWSEQHPRDWWSALEQAMSTLLDTVRAAGVSPDSIEAIGLTGQMHGATLLDAHGEVIRPAILWNDGRSATQCHELEVRVPLSREITGNLMMPGFTAPKLLWVAQNEPANFAQVAKILLPKDYLRYRLTGDYATDLSDAAGTLWLDVAARDWSDELLAATGLTRQHMPTLYEGNQITGWIKPELAARWGLQRIPVVAGASDNAAGAIGVGIIAPGQCMLSLGTSGVSFAVTEGFLANPESAVHSFCHALPHTWHLMSVMLSAASCLDFTAALTGHTDVPAMLVDAEQAGMKSSLPYFLPYLTGERTPHNNPSAKGVFFGLDATTDRADLANATLEGVGFGLLDGLEALEATGLNLGEISVIGGGSRSVYWLQMLADIFGRPLCQRAGGEVGPALGAARLAHLALHPEADFAAICPVPPVKQIFNPSAQRHAYFRNARRPTFQAVYRQLQSLF